MLLITSACSDARLDREPEGESPNDGG
jgi:hypothetical protein